MVPYSDHHLVTGLIFKPLFSYWTTIQIADIGLPDIHWSSVWMVPCFGYSDPHHCSHKNPDILSLQPHIKEGYLLLLGTVLSPDFFPDLLGLNTELKNCSIFFLPSLFLQFLLFIPCLYLCQGFLILFFPFFLYTVAKFEAIFLGFDFVSQLRLFVLGGLLSLIIFVSSIFLDKLFLEKKQEWSRPITHFACWAHFYLWNTEAGISVKC